MPRRAASSRGHGVHVIGAGAVHGHPVVAVVDLHQHGSGLDELALLHVDLHHVSGDSGADGIDVAIDLGVIGILILAALPPEGGGGDQQQHDQDAQQHGQPRLALE